VKKAVEEKEAEVKKAKKLAEEKEKERKNAQSELDDLLELFGDLEEKVTKYKVSFLLVVEWVGMWMDADVDCRNDSRSWGRRCRMQRRRRRRMRTGMMMTTMTRKKKSSRGGLWTGIQTTNKQGEEAARYHIIPLIGAEKRGQGDMCSGLKAGDLS
jgi:hypothetical protein